jgi:hypothetical protein
MPPWVARLVERRMKFFCIVATLLLASLVSAQTTIWGVTLGKRLNLPICKEGEYKSCQSEPKDYGAYTMNILDLSPDGGFAPSAAEIDGNLEYMSIREMDADVICGGFFAGLKEKFGQPSGRSKSTYHTGLGIPISVTIFVWNRERGDQILFLMPYPKTDECQFSASTLKWRSLKPNKVKF